VITWVCLQARLGQNLDQQLHIREAGVLPGIASQREARIGRQVTHLRGNGSVMAAPPGGFSLEAACRLLLPTA
jgi:hypothetical protein